jgi:hypothetical protein
VVATGVFLLAVIAAGLAVLKHHDAQLKSGISTVASSPPATSQAVSVAASPPMVVKRYYAAVSRRAYERAWKLGGDNTKTSYTQFVAGYGGTRRDVVTILTWTGNQVTAKIAAFQANGAVKEYQGTYLVRSGVITSFNVHQVG